MRRLPILLSVASLALLLLCTAAGADVFKPVSLASESPAEQALYAHDPAISGDGRYVAFDGYFGSRTGVWRRDLQTGAVEAVAVGEPGTPAGSAELPSISEDGRYVSFATTAQLASGDTNRAPDVYVRDMQLPESEAGAFTLASAVSGSEQGLTYTYGTEAFEETHYGSSASGRSALSADGRKVVFVTTAISNLAGGASPTPALEVAVRNLESKETQLVSVRYDPSTGKPMLNGETGQPEPVPQASEEGAGAVYKGGKSAPAFTSPQAYGIGDPPIVGASISADGSTVAWMGQNIAEQVPLLSQERETIAAVYAEPLWRRIADGPETPTRAITGASDPTDPACIASGEIALPGTPSPSDPCQGPFQAVPSRGLWDAGEGNPVPQLSADGSTVAFLANVPLVAQGADFGAGLEDRPADLYVASMAEGLSRTQALRALTELASGNVNEIGTDASILDLGISPDGSQVAFTTKRTVFPLGSPAYVSTPAAVPGMLELFDVDLADETLTRVTHGFEGGPAEHPHGQKSPGEDPYSLKTDGALSPSFSQDGNSLAFSSTASNLVYGDGNTPAQSEQFFDGSDAFVVERELFAPTPTETYILGQAGNPVLTPAWVIGANALSRANGTVLIEVEVPGAGTLRAGAGASVRVQSASSSRNAKGARKGSHARLSTTVRTRTVASAKRLVSEGSGGLTTLVLTLAHSYSALAARKGGLSATVSLSFSAPGRPTLHQSLAVSFLRATPARPARPAKKKKKKAHSKTSGHERR